MLRTSALLARLEAAGGMVVVVKGAAADALGSGCCCPVVPFAAASGDMAAVDAAVGTEAVAASASSENSLLSLWSGSICPKSIEIGIGTRSYMRYFCDML